MQGLSERDKADHLLSAFKQFDLDGSGYITHDELLSVLRGSGQDVSEEEVSGMLSDADTNRDGKVGADDMRCVIMNGQDVCEEEPGGVLREGNIGANTFSRT